MHLLNDSTQREGNVYKLMHIVTSVLRHWPTQRRYVPVCLVWCWSRRSGSSGRGRAAPCAAASWRHWAAGPWGWPGPLPLCPGRFHEPAVHKKPTDNLHLHLGHSADAFILIDFQREHLSEEEKQQYNAAGTARMFIEQVPSTYGC